MFARKHPPSKCLCFPSFPMVYEMLYGCRTGRGLRCVTQPSIAVAERVGIFFFQGLWALLTGALWDERIGGRDWQLGFFSPVFHCLISILSPAVRKTNYVFNPLLHPPPLLFRSSHLEIIMSLWQTTLAWLWRRGGAESPFASTQTGRWQLWTTFWPPKAVASHSFRAWPRLSSVLHTC